MKNTVRISALVALIFGASLTIGQTTFKTPVPEVKVLTPEEEKKTLTETVGLLTTLQLYQTYLNIGLLADGKAEGIYTQEAVIDLLGSIINPLEQVEKQLTRVSKIKLSKEDQDAIKLFQKILSNLQNQGKVLAAYWDKEKEEDAKLYETSRTAAWKDLQLLLKIEPQKEISPPPKEVPLKK
jgi:hypothetical protein